jgi:hypothetical protein
MCRGDGSVRFTVRAAVGEEECCEICARAGKAHSPLSLARLPLAAAVERDHAAIGQGQPEGLVVQQRNVFVLAFVPERQAARPALCFSAITE